MPTAETQEYLCVEEATDEEVSAGQEAPALRTELPFSLRVALPVAACLVISGLAAITLLPNQAPMTAKPSIAIRRWEEDLKSTQCGMMENNTEYVEYSGWGKSLDHVPGPEMCCAFCQIATSYLSERRLKDPTI
ncbi:unnamed protein product [Symbiodinium natans]|uniref:Uncharacterized protein n=1 Tax=Symbiodinium natans TaxID=878477 RepID=A0A812TU62_9DINO|nr:unnamed protein product [Symbiodinium natans]